MSDTHNCAPSSTSHALQTDVSLPPGDFLTPSGCYTTRVLQPYPIADTGLPVAPASLTLPSRSHSFELPRCFHGVGADVSTYLVPSSPIQGHTIATCGVHTMPKCNFFFPITAVHLSGRFDPSPEEERPRQVPNLPPSLRPPLSSVLPVENVMFDVAVDEDPGTATGRCFIDAQTKDYEGKGTSADPIVVPDCLEPVGTAANPIVVPDDTILTPTRPVTPIVVRIHDHYSDPRGGLRSCWDLSHNGVVKEHFLKMFVECPGCAKVMVGACFGDHACELDDD
ncbi:hypothetical protein ONZ45_g7025 [Pleurotus djamor]|nr:hypothetical protein ONZ45_g7025 [Pleurotus djamor]